MAYTNDNANNSNVMFMRGLHSALPSTNIQDGAFYLTTDTNRLFVGNNGKLADLNQYIIKVANVAGLAALENVENGDFVYCESENILAICVNKNATTVEQKWKQVNPDTNTNVNTKLTGVTASIDESTNNKDTVTLTFKQVTYDLIEGTQAAEADITCSFELNFKDNISVGLNATSVTNGAEVSIESDNVTIGDKVTVLGGDNVTVSAANDIITVAADDTTYTLSSDVDVVKLTPNEGETSTVSTLDGNVINSATTAAGIKFDHAAVPNSKVKASAAFEGVDGATKEVVTGITVSAEGHVTKVDTQDINFVNTTYKLEGANVGDPGIELDNQGDVRVYLKDSEGGLSTAEAANAIYYTVGKDTKTTIYNQNDLNVYTIPEIDSKLMAVNAMVYKGTVGTGGTTTILPLTAEIGWTYKVVSAGTYANQECEVGDLLIANGTENENGQLTSITWDYVPSGDDHDTQHELTVTAGTDSANIVLENNVDGMENTQVTIMAGTAIDVEANTANKTITVTHEKVTVDKTPASQALQPAHGGKFTVIGAVEANDEGHVTKISAQEVELPELTLDHNVGGSAGAATIDLVENGVSKPVTVKAGTQVTVTPDATNKAITVGHATIANNGPTEASDVTLGSGGTFKVVTGITRADNGHVSSYETTDFTLPASKNVTYGYGGEITAVTDGAKYATTLTPSEGESQTVEVSVVSESLEIVADNANKEISIDLAWGSF